MTLRAVFFLMCAFVATATAAEKPNIVYILADDLGWGDVGCYGGKAIPTPNLDRMAREGMRFTQHYAGSTVCAPSRCVLLTGKHTGRCRVRGNSPGVMKAEDVTVAEVLKAAGYRTGCVGKWGVGNPPPLDDPGRNGFDYFFGYISMWHAHNFYPEFLIRNGKRVPLRNEVQAKWKAGDGRGIATKRVDYAPDVLAADALKFLETNKGWPFFLYYALNIPHANNEAGRSNRPERGLEVPEFAPFVKKEWPAPEKGFATMVHNIDRDVGRILAKLKELGLDEKTLVIFTSDNGPHQEGGHKMEFFDSNGPLRGRKRDLFEGGIREPMIVRWPGVVKAGSVSDHLSGFQDVLPTLAEVASIAVPKHIDGISMLPTLRGEPAKQQRHEYLYWEFTEQGGKRALRQGKWKIVQLKMQSAKPAPPMLFDLVADPSEETDIASKHPDVVARLVKLMDEAHSPSKAYPFTAAERRGR